MGQGRADRDARTRDRPTPPWPTSGSSRIPTARSWSRPGRARTGRPTSSPSRPASSRWASGPSPGSPRRSRAPSSRRPSASSSSATERRPNGWARAGVPDPPGQSHGRHPVTIAAEIETRIERSPEDVFDALVAVEQFPQWLIASGITRVERLDDGAGRPPDRRSGSPSPSAVGRRSSTGTITRLDPGRAFGLQARDPDGVTIEIDADLTPGCRRHQARWSVRIGLPLRFRMFESMVAPQVRRAATLDLEALKRRLESNHGLIRYAGTWTCVHAATRRMPMLRGLAGSYGAGMTTTRPLIAAAILTLSGLLVATAATAIGVASIVVRAGLRGDPGRNPAPRRPRRRAPVHRCLRRHRPDHRARARPWTCLGRRRRLRDRPRRGRDGDDRPPSPAFWGTIPRH